MTGHRSRADEPTANLDSGNGRRIVKLLRELCSTGRTVVIIATQERSVASQCDAIIELRDEQIQNARI